MEDFLIEVWNDDVRFRFPDPDDDGEDIARCEVFWGVTFLFGCIVHILYINEIEGRSTPEILISLGEKIYFY